MTSTATTGPHPSMQVWAVWVTDFSGARARKQTPRAGRTNTPLHARSQQDDDTHTHLFLHLDSRRIILLLVLGPVLGVIATPKPVPELCLGLSIARTHSHHSLVLVLVVLVLVVLVLVV